MHSRTFLSFSKIENKILRFLGSTDNKYYGVVFKLRNDVNIDDKYATNADLENISRYPAEKEVLFFHQTTFCLKNITKDNYNGRKDIIIITFDYLGKYEKVFDDFKKDDDFQNEFIYNFQPQEKTYISEVSNYALFPYLFEPKETYYQNKTKSIYSNSENGTLFKDIISKINKRSDEKKSKSKKTPDSITKNEKSTQKGGNVFDTPGYNTINENNEMPTGEALFDIHIPEEKIIIKEGNLEEQDILNIIEENINLTGNLLYKNLKQEANVIWDYLTPKPKANVIEDITIIEVPEIIEIIPKIERINEVIIDEKFIEHMKIINQKENENIFHLTTFKLGQIKYIWNGKKNKYNKIIGKGVEYNYDHNLIFSGEYNEGFKIKGIDYYIKETKKFEGEYNKGLRWNGFLFDLENNEKYKIKFGKGLVKEFHENRCLLYEGEIQNGQREGKGKLFDQCGRLIYEGEFKKGMKDGKGEEYNENGDLIFVGQFKNGEKIKGNFKEYNDECELVKEGVLLPDGNYEVKKIYKTIKNFKIIYI